MANHDPQGRSRFFRAVDAVAALLERAFRPFVGGAQVGGAMTPAPEPTDFVCGSCGQPISRHRFGSGAEGRMYCPPARSATPPPA